MRTALTRGPSIVCQNHTFSPRTGADLTPPPTLQSFLFEATKYIHDRQCTCNSTLRRVRATTVAVEKQWVLHTCYEYVFVAVGIENAMYMRHIEWSVVGWSSKWKEVKCWPVWWRGAKVLVTGCLSLLVYIQITYGCFVHHIVSTFFRLYLVSLYRVRQKNLTIFKLK